MKLIMMKFELVEGESQLIVGLDVKKYSDTINRGESPMKVFRHQNYVSDR